MQALPPSERRDEVIQVKRELAKHLKVRWGMKKYIQKYMAFRLALRDPLLLGDVKKLNLVLDLLKRSRWSRWSMAMALVTGLWQRGMEYAPALDYPKTGALLVLSLRLGMQWEQAVLLADGSHQLGKDPETCRVAPGSCGMARQWHQALAGLSALRNAGIELTNDALRGSFTCPDDAWLGSLKFLRMLRKVDLRPSTMELSKVLSFSARISWSYTLYFLNLARTEAVILTDGVSSACLSAFCRRFRPWEAACNLLSDFNQWAVMLRRRSFNAALGVFTRRPKLWKQVLNFVPPIEDAWTRRISFRPDNAARDACRIARARRVAEAMRSRRKTAATLRQSPWQQALCALEELGGSQSLKLSLTDLQAAVKACKDSSEWEMGLEISQRLATVVQALL